MAQNIPCTNPSLWMGDLAPYMDEAFIKSAFQIMGQVVVSVRILPDKKTGLHGYCFVDFGEIELAKRAFQVCNNRRIPNSVANQPKRFKLNFSFTTFQKDMHLAQTPHFGTECTVHVSNLSPDVTDDQLYTHFISRFSSVRKASVIWDGSISRGYGFVDFATESDVPEAIRIFNGSVGLGSKAIRVGYKTFRNQPHGINNSTGTPPAKPIGTSPVGGPPPPMYTSPPPQMMQQQHVPPHQEQQQQQQQQPAEYKAPKTKQAAPKSKQVQKQAHSEKRKFQDMMDQYTLGFGSYTDDFLKGISDPTKEMKYGGEDGSVVEEDDPLEDPEIMIDVDKSNQLLMEASEEFYRALEESRWQTVDTITTTYADLCKA